MRAALVLVQFFGPLAVLASNVDRGLERDIHDSPLGPTPDIFGDGTGLYGQWPQLGSVPVNRTEGSIRSAKRQSNNLLESRQSTVILLLLLFSTRAYFASRPRLCPTGVLGSRFHPRVSYLGPLSVLRPQVPHLCVQRPADCLLQTLSTNY